MCMGMCNEPTIYGMPLDLAMEIEDGVPDCCYGPMDTKPADTDGHREYECGDCGTVVEVDDLGLVWDIREKVAA
jgi:hypothetical protein